jgi:hypothetical protein
MCCSLCADMHIGHTKAYFKDLFVEKNYENVDQTPQETLQKIGTIHQSGNVFFRQDQVLPKRPEEAKSNDSSQSPYQEKYTSMFHGENKAQIQSFVPNFEIYVANDALTEQRVQIKIIKNFGDKKQAFKDSVMCQVRNLSVFGSNCKRSRVMHLIEHMIAHNNLYLVSEAHEISLVEHLPYLIEQNHRNELVSVLVIHDLLKILNTTLEQEQSSICCPTFNKFKEHHETNGQQASTQMTVYFDPRTFYFVNGRLKYCPHLLSPCHNVTESSLKIERDDQTKQNALRNENFGFISRLIFQFMMYSNETDESNSVHRRLHGLVMVLVEFKRENKSELKHMIAQVRKFKQITKDLINSDPSMTFQAKLIIRRNYKFFDNHFYLNAS